MLGDTLKQRAGVLLETFIGSALSFINLALLVVITTFMSRFISRYFPEPVAAPRARPAPAAATPPAGQVNDEVVAAISAAIRQHRQPRR